MAAMKKQKQYWNFDKAAPQAKGTQPIAVRLSQCMIVKDEEANMERALSWGKGLVCEQIVVDTGSTDRTVEIAKAMGATVLHFPWNDDFSAAKNFAIEHASGNWIAFLDADEYITPKGTEKLLPMLKEMEGYWQNPQQKDKPHVMRTPLINLNAQGEMFEATTQQRFFRNMLGLRYRGRIHEQLFLPYDRLLIRMDVEDIPIFHTGYQNDVVDKAKKSERNIRLLKREIEQYPERLELKVYLADALLLLREAEPMREAAVLYDEVLNKPEAHTPPVFRTRAIIALLLLSLKLVCPRERMEEIFNKAVRQFPDAPDFDYCMGCYFFDQAQWHEAIAYFEQALTKAEAYRETEANKGGAIRIAADIRSVYEKLMIAAANLEDPKRIVKYGVPLLSKTKDNVRVLIKVSAAMYLGEPPATDGEVFALYNQIYDLHDPKDRLITYKAASKVGQAGLAQLVFNTFTEEEKGWLRQGQARKN